MSSLRWIFAAALAVRLAALFLLAPHRAAEGSSTWDFGHEAACLGESLLEGRGLADPWAHGTGASGWLTPPYPALLAALMALFGGVGSATALALFVLQSVASAATCAWTAVLGRQLGAARAGVFGAWFLALYPPSVWNATQVVWDTTFVAFGTVGCLVLLTRPGADSRPLTRVGLGLAFGCLAFLNPAPLALLPGVLVYLAWPRTGWRARLFACAQFSLALAVVVAPWMARNARVLGTAGLRPNFGVELRLGNNPESNGHPQPFKFHPSHVPAELARYRELGEVAYAQDCARRAIEWMRAEPASFLRLTARRVQYFWLGDFPWSDARRSGGPKPLLDPNAWLKFLSFASLGVLGWLGALRWRHGRERALLVLGLAGFGLAYYVTHVSERYRFPIDPLLALGAAAVVCGWLERRSATSIEPRTTP